MTRFTSNASSAPFVAPGDLPSAIGVLGPGHGLPIGMATQAGYLGGCDGHADDEPYPRPEAAWRLAVGGEELEGLWALRGGVFVQLAEDED